MFKKIFRSDLNLNQYWWHRLLKVLLICVIICFLFISFKISLEDSQYHHKRIANLDDRLDSGVSKIEDLLQFGERFTDSGWQGEKDSFSKSKIYCSKNLSDIDNIKIIINESGINNFNRLRRNEGNIDIESFSMMLRSSNAKCIIEDNAEIDFLNPMIELNDFGFYTPSRITYLKDSVFIPYFITSFLFIIGFIYLLYYQVFLYIIFGRKNNF